MFDLYIEFICPPMPHMIVAGTSVFRAGDIHERRIMNDTFDLIVIEKGGLFLQENEERYTLSKGDYLILSPDRLHRSFKPCLEDTYFNWLHFSTTGEFNVGTTMKQQNLRRMNRKKYYRRDDFSIFISKNGHLDDQSLEFFLHSMNSLVEVQINNFKREKKFLEAKVDFLESQQLFLSILSAISTKNTESITQNLASQIYTYLASNTKQDFSLDRLATIFAYHKSYIIKVMNDNYQKTPSQIHTHFRLEEAKSLLIETTFAIQKISEEVGYHDTAYFSKTFKKQFGVTPSEFRNKKTPDSHL